MTTKKETVLQLKNITKLFPGVRALSEVSFDIKGGEVHALLGENGAGKSTLMKVLAGMYQPDGGHIQMGDKKLNLNTPLEAKAHGIILIHQELSLVEETSVAENVYLGELPRNKLGFVDWKKLYQKTNDILQRLNCGFEAHEQVEKLSIAKKQMVEIARALTVEAKVVVFDEPTASLTDYEKVVLFDIIEDLKAQNVGIVYISHRMDEIFHLSDRITVLRDGEHTGTLISKETNEDEVTQLMIGRSLDYSRNMEHVEGGKIKLEVKNLSCEGLYEDVSFAVKEGEVLGFYGLVGARRTEVVETIFGLRKPCAGQIFVEGEEVAFRSPDEAIKKGISLVPENRKEQGLVLGLNCRDNISLPQIDALRRGPFMSFKQEQDIYDEYQQKLQIKSPSWRQIVGNLSGGNQQKIVIAKWLAMAPKILMVDEPTRGIDVGSKEEIHKLIRRLAKSGYAIIVISSEMPEVLNVSDRIIAMYHGRITKEFTTADVTEDALVQAVSGIVKEEEPAA